jgi:hypothetical protein
VFDVELDASYTVNSSGAVSQVRFPQSASGKAVVAFAPTGFIPPNTDRDFGYKNTIGVRLGGQYNVLSDKLAIMSGGWFETAAADDEYLNTAPVPAMRGGFGGGILLRQKPIDFVIGYQRHLSKEMDNGGNGATHANAGAPVGAGKDASFAIGQPPADLQFRTAQAVNGGRLTHSANVFTLGAVFRF